MVHNTFPKVVKGFLFEEKAQSESVYENEKGGIASDSYQSSLLERSEILLQWSVDEGWVLVDEPLPSCEVLSESL